MPQFVDLASVFQLGAGVSLALSVFKEPIAIAEDRVRSKLDRRLRLLPSAKNAEVNDKRQALLQKKAELRVHVVAAETLAHIPKKLILFGVAINFALLFASVIWAECDLTIGTSIALLSASAVPYLVALFWLQLIAALKIGSGD